MKQLSILLIGMDRQRQCRVPTPTNDNATGLGTKLANGFARRRYTSESPAYFAPHSRITPPSIRSHPCFSHANSGPTRPVGELANWPASLRYHQFLDPARLRVHSQGVIDGALVGLRARRLAYVQGAAVSAAKTAGYPLLAAKNAAQRLP